MTALIQSSIDSFEEAEFEGFENWNNKSVFRRVEDVGQTFLTTRWVLTEKEGRKKARLVVRGFEDPELSRVVKDSPTCTKETFRIALIFAATLGWTGNSMDIRTAFLQGMPLRRIVHIKPPPELNQSLNELWLLLKGVYGLVDAARFSYETVNF